MDASVIMALVTAAGPLGLSTVFPPKHAIYQTERDDEQLRTVDYLDPPHLPLSATWQEGNFSAESVFSKTSLPGEPVNLRKWTMQLLSRYLYMDGRSISHFHMALSPSHVQSVFRNVDSHPEVQPNIEGKRDGSVILTHLFRCRYPSWASTTTSIPTTRRLDAS